MKRAVIVSAVVLGLALVLPACKCRPAMKKAPAPATMVAAPKAEKRAAMPAEKKPVATVVMTAEKKAAAKPVAHKMAAEKPKAAKKEHDHTCPGIWWSGCYMDEADRPMDRLRDDLPPGGCCCCPHGG